MLLNAKRAIAQIYYDKNKTRFDDDDDDDDDDDRFVLDLHAWLDFYCTSTNNVQIDISCHSSQCSYSISCVLSVEEATTNFIVFC